MTDRPTVLATLRFLRSGWIGGQDNVEYLDDVIFALERWDPADLDPCCPMCQEVECDSNCPLHPHRRQVTEGAPGESPPPVSEDSAPRKI